MRLLVDANLSPSLAGELVAAGHDAVHVGAVGLLSASDDEILEWAMEATRVIVTADSDFPMMLALRRASRPSVVLLRHMTNVPIAAQRPLLLANLPSVEHELERGAIVSLSPTRLAVRNLPVES